MFKRINKDEFETRNPEIRKNLAKDMLYSNTYYVVDENEKNFGIFIMNSAYIAIIDGKRYWCDYDFEKMIRLLEDANKS